MGVVCQTCGDTGFKELLLCCSMCHITTEHRYCLMEILTADDEEFTYRCEQCVSISNLSRQPPVNDQPIIDQLCSREAKTRDFPPCNLQASVREHFVASNVLPPFCDVNSYEDEEQHNRKRRRRTHEGLELYTVPIAQVDSFSFASPLETTSQPIIDPAWRGCFEICREKIGRFVAHLSNKACLKVVEAAKFLPVVLSMKMMPRTEAWPKSFSASAPSDENIALYFFPGSESAVKGFDELVNQTMKQDLALKALIHSVELLIFSSNQLPLPYWTFKGKYYFWGVFRGGKESSGEGAGINKKSTEASCITHLGPAIGFCSGSQSSPKLPLLSKTY